MSKIVSVVYHSGYGHTAKVAEAIAAGAAIDGATVHLLKADALTDADWETLDASHAIIFGAPTYMGSASAQFKTFMDASSKRWYTHAWKDKIAAGFTISASYSGDKFGTLQQLITFAMQHGMIWVGQSEKGPTLGGTDVPALDAINRVGSYSGLMSQANALSPADVMPPAGDLETARIFGKRVAEVTKKFA